MGTRHRLARVTEANDPGTSRQTADVVDVRDFLRGIESLRELPRGVPLAARQPWSAEPGRSSIIRLFPPRR